MKKRAISFVLALVMCLGLAASLGVAAANSDITIMFEGMPLSLTDPVSGQVIIQGPVAMGGTGSGAQFQGEQVYVPVRMFSQLGLAWSFDSVTQTVSMILEVGPDRGSTIRISEGAPSFEVTHALTGNTITHQLPPLVSARVISGVFMVPIQPLLEAVGWYVDWDSAARLVHVSAYPMPQPLQQPIPIVQPIQDFSITIGTSIPGILARRREITVEAISTTNLDGKFLIVQVSTPGARRMPTVSAIRLQDSRREVVTISYTNPNSVIDIKLVENAAHFLDPMLVIHASADTR